MLGNHRFGIQKNNWNNSLFLAGRCSATTPRHRPTTRKRTSVEWHTFNSTGGPYNGKPLAMQQEEQLPNHSPYYTNLSEPPAPSIMENGWNDDLFPVDETVEYYNKVRVGLPEPADAAVRLGPRAQPAVGDDALDQRSAKFQTAQNKWFEYYVKGEGGEPSEAMVA